MTPKRAGQFIGTLVAMTLVACGKSRGPMDNGLAQDLAAVKHSASQVVVSDIEAGPQAAPARIATAPVAKPSSRPAAPRAAPHSVAPPEAPTPHAAVAATVQAPTPRATSERAPDPAPLPAATSGHGTQQDRGTRTEAEIFRRMPWIRP